MIYNNVLEAIGHTPMIRLNSICEPGCAEILVKYEGLCIGGSIKTRTAYNMILAAEREGLINENTVIVEPTSGNQGIGLALVGAVRGYKVVIIMPDSVSEERRKLVRQYGAEVILIHDDGDIGECIDNCLKTAMRMAEEDPNVYVPQQFTNRNNPLVHKHHTGLEILEQAAGDIHGFCSGVGTGGTISGIGEVLKAQYPDIEIWAVEPEHAAILAGGNIGTHLQMGIGDGLIPDNLNMSIYSDICLITDEEALTMSKRLAREEGILCGISSGSNVAAAVRLARKLGAGKRVVTILPDTGERYFSTPLFEQ
ncbi:MAG: cysteine synthase A [Ruminococcaceae bacterium]|nr:cysteine synthase A [Oscillospiraceae bacterium]